MRVTDSDDTQCRSIWLKRLYNLKSSAGRALRARIRLRDILKREPSVAEVRGRLQDGPVKETLQFRELSAAFRSGEEVRPGHMLLS